MLVLKTRMGIFLMNNVVRVDFSRQKENKNYMCFFSIDNYKFPIQSFENETDACIFNIHLEVTLTDWLTENHTENSTLDLNDACADAIEYAINTFPQSRITNTCKADLHDSENKEIA